MPQRRSEFLPTHKGWCFLRSKSMNPYGVDTRETNLTGPLARLKIIYEEMPPTTGCDRCAEKNGADQKDWCCLLPGSMVYTDLGPVPVKTVREQDRVFTKSGLKQVKKVGHHDIDEEIAVVRTAYGRCLRLTSDHKVFAAFGRYRSDCVDRFRYMQSPVFIEAKMLQTGYRYRHYVVFPKIQIPDDNKVLVCLTDYVGDLYVSDNACYWSRTRQELRGKPIPLHLEIDDKFAFVIGLFLAKGSISGNTVDFHFHCLEDELVERIEEFCDRFDLWCSHKHNRGDSYTHSVCSAIMAKFFLSICGKGCDNKRLHSTIFGHLLKSRRLIQSLHDGYYAGDGARSETLYSYTTTSSILHQQMMFINLILGRISSSSYYSTDAKKPVWTSSFSYSHSDCLECDDYFLVPVRSVTYEKYRGPVYDLEIEGEESFSTECGEVHNCKTQNPSMYYVEFLYAWKKVQQWSKIERTQLILRAIRNYLSNDLSKGCVFYHPCDGCQIYDRRPYICVGGDVFVLTNRGPKKIKHVVAGDLVMTHRGRFRAVRATASILTHKPKVLIRVNGFNWSSSFTSDHPFYTCQAKDKRKNFTSALEWTNAGELVMKTAHSNGSYVMYPSIRFGQHPSKEIWVKNFVDGRVLNERIYSLTSNDESNSIPARWNVSDDFLWMLGIYLAEGSNTKSLVNFSLHIDEKETIGARLKRYMSSQGFNNPTETTKRNSYTITYTSAMLGRFLSTLCGNGASKKQLHGYLFETFSNEQLMKIFEGWKEGDGQRGDQKTYKWRVTTISESLCMQMYFILISNGIAPYVVREKRDSRYHASYNIIVHHSAFEPKTGEGTAYKWEEQTLFRPVKFVEGDQDQDQDNPVFDLDVEEDGSFVTEAGVVHNCRMYGVICPEHWDKRWTELKERQKERFGAKPQCPLVAVADPNYPSSHVLAEDEDQWFKQIVTCEKRIGVQSHILRLHDEPGGSYRTFHDHLLIELFEPKFLEMLSKTRMTNPSADDIEKTIDVLSKFLSEYNLVQ